MKTANEMKTTLENNKAEFNAIIAMEKAKALKEILEGSIQFCENNVSKALEEAVARRANNCSFLFSRPQLSYSKHYTEHLLKNTEYSNQIIGRYGEKDSLILNVQFISNYLIDHGYKVEQNEYKYRVGKGPYAERYGICLVVSIPE